MVIVSSSSVISCLMAELRPACWQYMWLLSCYRYPATASLRCPHSSCRIGRRKIPMRRSSRNASKSADTGVISEVRTEMEVEEKEPAFLTKHWHVTVTPHPTVHFWRTLLGSNKSMGVSGSRCIDNSSVFIRRARVKFTAQKSDPGTGWQFLSSWQCCNVPKSLHHDRPQTLRHPNLMILESDFCHGISFGCHLCSHINVAPSIDDDRRWSNHVHAVRAAWLSDKLICRHLTSRPSEFGLSLVLPHS
ncbi:hypothetical protein ARMGADRAFT_191985 [Armillaria gallica]|uniref:Uncharacterized protein n=1 Tax=Armillaria gallica TaxID=47427 RepID=A0A2H3D9G6_ARMGA|nr:hypothetical protein ARMGADRAFT_191985 [Armillaria gallica]